MINRKKLVVANWKMNLSIHQASILVNRLEHHLKVYQNVEVVLAPNYLCLQPLSLQLDKRKFSLASQDGYFVDEGSYTGEVSFSQLSNLVQYSIIGHSERRHYFNEGLGIVRDKVAAAVRNNIIPIICVGETKEERLHHETKQVIHDQITTALSNLTSEDVAKLVVAYEPVWAIGATKPATPEEISPVADWIRYQIRELYGEKTEQSVRLLYGGSSEPEYVKALMSINTIDGLLVGRASLNYIQFSAIVNNVYKLNLDFNQHKDVIHD